MTDYVLARRPSRRISGGAIAILSILGGLGVLCAPIAYMLWPSWPDQVRLDAPSLPISIGGVVFNVPPAAIRAPVQRRPGTRHCQPTHKGLPAKLIPFDFKTPFPATMVSSEDR